MSFLWLENAFQRAFAFTFSKKRFVITFATLFLSGLFFLLFQFLAIKQKGFWLFSSYFFPYFISLFFVIPLGVLLCKSYAFEAQGKAFSWKKYLETSWEKLFISSLFAFPFMATFLVLWLFLGLFSLSQMTPFLESFVSSLLFFIPFISSFFICLLVILSVVFLFIAVPSYAFQERRKNFSLSFFLSSWKKSPLQSLLVAFFALVPMYILWALWGSAKAFSYTVTSGELSVFALLVQGFILNLFASFLLSIGVIFFFHMAVEAFSIRAKS